MNYLAHGYRFVSDPYFVAGTALPDWMSVLDRRNRARSKAAAVWINADNPGLAALARGVMRHHSDDHWFHQTEAFTVLSTQFAVELRQQLQAGHQAGFLGHIAVELLLDAVLMEGAPGRLEAYYNALASLDPRDVQFLANQILIKPVEHLSILIPRFIAERFLADYADDQLLWRRLNHVMRRVGLPALPESIIQWLGSARPRVRAEAQRLLTDTSSLQNTHSLQETTT